MDEFSSREYKKLLWRCRRGTKELDLILADFIQSNYPALSVRELSDLRKLLEQEDSLLTEWLCHRQRPNIQGVEKIVERILSAD